MIGTITEQTEKFLQECKKAGYERVTVFVTDKRVPDSVRIEKGSCVSDAGNYWGRGTKYNPYRVVCGAPEQRGSHHSLPGNHWPKMWEIVKRLGLHPAGAGSGDAHDVLCVNTLTGGYYDLAELAGEI